MLDFSALKEAQTAINTVGHSGIEQRGFHHPTLRVAAVEQRDFFPISAVAHQLFDFIDEPLRFGEITGRFIHPHRLARASVRAQIFAQALAVVADQRVG